MGGQQPWYRLPPFIGTSKAHLPPPASTGGGKPNLIQPGGTHCIPPLLGILPPLTSTPTAQLVLSCFRGLAAPQGTSPSLFSTWEAVTLMSPPHLPGPQGGSETGAPAGTDPLTRAGCNAAAPPFPSLLLPCI